MSKINFDDVLKKYDLNALIEVVSDRVQDFNEHVVCGGNEDSYRPGFSENLQQALGLLYDIKLCQELSSSPKKSKKKIG